MRITKVLQVFMLCIAMCLCIQAEELVTEHDLMGHWRFVNGGEEFDLVLQGQGRAQVNVYVGGCIFYEPENASWQLDNGVLMIDTVSSKNISYKIHRLSQTQLHVFDNFNEKNITLNKVKVSLEAE